jgi:hypothetical protein
MAKSELQTGGASGPSGIKAIPITATTGFRAVIVLKNYNKITQAKEAYDALKNSITKYAPSVVDLEGGSDSAKCRIASKVVREKINALSESEQEKILKLVDELKKAADCALDPK